MAARSLGPGWRIVLGATLMSMLVVVAPRTHAHEVLPAISDLSVTGDRLDWEIELSLEPLIADVDLDGLEDTNEARNADAHDTLRALPPDALEQAFEGFWPEMRDRLTIRSGDAPVTPRLEGLEVLPEPNLDLARKSILRLSAALPPGDAPVVVGWPADYGALVVREQRADGGEGYTGYLTGGELSDPIPRTGGSPEGALATFATYVVIGFEHIIPKGLDHILFVLGLFFLSQRFGPLLWQVTAFTVAHTITLALATLGYVSVPASVVEPLIALSIAYVGIENVLARGLTPWRPVVVFGFGLLHGLGFASVLGEIGLAPATLVAGLIGFNVGVELGQLAVIALAFLAVASWARHRDWYRNAVANPASLAIAIVGGWWAFERTFL